MIVPAAAARSRRHAEGAPRPVRVAEQPGGDAWTAPGRPGARPRSRCTARGPRSLIRSVRTGTVAFFRGGRRASGSRPRSRTPRRSASCSTTSEPRRRGVASASSWPAWLAEIFSAEPAASASSADRVGLAQQVPLALPPERRSGRALAAARGGEMRMQRITVRRNAVAALGRSRARGSAARRSRGRRVRRGRAQGGLAPRGRRRPPRERPQRARAARVPRRREARPEERPRAATRSPTPISRAASAPTRSSTCAARSSCSRTTTTRGSSSRRCCSIEKRYAEAIPECDRLIDDPTFASPWRALTNRAWAEYKLGRARARRATRSRIAREYRARLLAGHARARDPRGRRGPPRRGDPPVRGDHRAEPGPGGRVRGELPDRRDLRGARQAPARRWAT